MRNLRYLLVMILALASSMAIAQEKPFLVIDENGDQYEILLKIDNTDNIASVQVLGHYVLDGQQNMLSVKIDGESITEFDGKVALIHQLAKCCDAASYTVLVTNKDGEVSGYPEVNIDLNALALNAVAQDVEDF